MRLRLLEPIIGRVARHISAISRKLRLDVLALSPSAEPPDTLIILGDGEPDDYVMALVAWACDGERTAFITRPREMGITSAIRLLKEVYLPKAPHLRRAIVVIDRHRKPLSDITDEALRALEQYGFEIRGHGESAQGWLKEFSCVWRPRAEIDILVLVNGMGKDDIYSEDTVEVHLLEAARHVLGQEAVEGLLREARDEEDKHGRANPERAWHRSLSRSEQWEVFRSLLKRPDLLRSIFRQHLRALEAAESMQRI